MTDRNDLDVAGYAGAVRAALADLGAGERGHLLEDLEAHLADVAAESDAPLADRLGPPEAYAAELSAAYGGQRSVPPAATPSGPRRSRRWRLAYLLLLLPLVPVGLSLSWTARSVTPPSGGDAWTTGRLLSEAQANHVASVEMHGGDVVAIERTGTRHSVAAPSDTVELAQTLTQDGVDVTYEQSDAGWLATLLFAVVLPNLVLVALIVAVVRYVGRARRRTA
jgi:hypothetical protein